ncbi:MAG: YfiR family protein [Phycisphaerales bacterium]
MTVSHSAVVRAEDAIDREYRIKAAFVYNFLKFVEGGRFAPAPGRKKDEVDPNDPLVIGVLGVPPSRIAFEEFNGKQIGNRAIVVRWFKGFEELADQDKKIPERHPDLDRIKACHVLFLCPSEKAFLPRVLPHLRESGMLTVGDVPLFLENGGTINLLIEERKVRFEINLAAAARAKLEIRSSLLRLAVRTIEHDQLAQQKDEEDPGGAGRP